MPVLNGLEAARLKASPVTRHTVDGAYGELVDQRFGTQGSVRGSPGEARERRSVPLHRAAARRGRQLSIN